jgi:hypothetical protein
VLRAYNRTDLFGPAASPDEDVADYVCGDADSNVVPLRAARS